MSKVQNPDPADTRITDNRTWRDGYSEGFLDALGLVANLDAEHLAAISNLAARRRTLTEAELNVIRAAGRSDGGFAEAFLERQRLHRRSTGEPGATCDRCGEPAPADPDMPCPLCSPFRIGGGW